MKKFPWIKTDDSPQQGNLFPANPPPIAAPIEPAQPPPISRATPIAVPTVSKPERLIFTVGELTRDIKTTLERGYPHLWVRGEISGFRGANARGHLYFSLKDADA